MLQRHPRWTLLIGYGRVESGRQLHFRQAIDGREEVGHPGIARFGCAGYDNFHVTRALKSGRVSFPPTSTTAGA